MVAAGGRAFSLIELLVSVAIISVLAAIALPNFMEAQTRAKVAATQADLRTLALALESYDADNHAYPQAAVILPWMRLRALTTPIAYITRVPSDPFLRAGPAEGYRYGAMPLDNASRWVLGGVGPDLRPSMDPIEFYPGYRAGLFVGAVVGFDYMLYDPTNGALSWGDIVRASDAHVE